VDDTARAGRYIALVAARRPARLLERRSALARRWHRCTPGDHVRRFVSV